MKHSHGSSHGLGKGASAMSKGYRTWPIASGGKAGKRTTCSPGKNMKGKPGSTHGRPAANPKV